VEDRVERVVVYADGVAGVGELKSTKISEAESVEELELIGEGSPVDESLNVRGPLVNVVSYGAEAED
jgi:hypothetical protein